MLDYAEYCDHVINGIGNQRAIIGEPFVGEL
jgi:hypothetical protein